MSIEALSRMDMIITCQGGDYTKEIFPRLRAAGWQGHWIDAASTLRMHDDAVIILDPVNLDVIKDALHQGRSQLDRWQLHGFADVDGHWRSVAAGSRRMGQRHDLSGSVRGRSTEHARTAAADGRAA
jgi:hypothetical protein